MKIGSFLLVLFLALAVHAQTPVSNAFAFANGVYQQHRDFAANKPAAAIRNWDESWVQLDREGNILVLTEAGLGALRQRELQPETFWGLVFQQTPYVRVIPDSSRPADFYFTKMHVIGKLCYFYYKGFENETVLMSVFNPIFQRKVAEKPIVNKKQVLIQRLMPFESGEVVPYNEANLMRYIATDAKLRESVADLPKPIAAEQLFKTLLIFNERNPVYLQKP